MDELQGTDLVHIKNSILDDYALCGFTSGSMGHTTKTSARAISTCAECLSELFSLTCSLCMGNGTLKDYDEEWPCPSCSIDQAEIFIRDRGIGNFRLSMEQTAAQESRGKKK